MSLRSAKAVAHEERSPDGMPEVRLEVRQGANRVHTYDLGNLEFLIGSVPGCDLRLPGVDLPPLFCLLTRHADGLRLRKLAPTQFLLVNGETVHQRELNNGDRVTVGATDIVIHMQAGAPPAVEKAPPTDLQRHVLQLREQVLKLQEDRKTFEEEQRQSEREWEQKAKRLDQEQRALVEERTRLETLRFAEADVAKPVASPVPSALIEREKALERRSADVLRQQQELGAVRQELADLRNQLYQRYQERRDRLSGLQEAVDRAAAKVQDQKRAFDRERREWTATQEAFAQRQALLEQRGRDLADARRRLDEERATWEDNQTPLRAELASREDDLAQRETALAQRVSEHETKSRQYQADVLRLDRLQGELANREQDLAKQAEALDQERRRVDQSSEELESQVLDLDQWRKQLAEDAEQLKTQRAESDALARDLDQRAANLEGQQATFAGLRTRLERLREDLRGREQQLEEERGKQQEVLTEIEENQRALSEREAELAQEQAHFTQQREDWSTRSATLEAAVRQLKLAQEQIGAKEQSLQEQEADLAARQNGLVEHERLLQGRLEQVAQTQERLDAERTALRERTQALTQTELAREGLQESLRRRAEDLARCQQTLDAQADDLDAQTKLVQEGRLQQEEQLKQDRLALEEAQRQLALAREAWDKERADFQDRSQHHLRQFEQLQDLGRQLAAQRKALAEERLETLQKKDELERTQEAFKAEEADLRGQIRELTRQLPEIELRAGTVADRLAQAREELRDHLAELHEFVRVSRRDLEQLGERLAEEERQLRLQEQDLRQGQEEHRLALAAFRQQLLGWQGQIAEMKRLLAQDQSRLQLRQAEVEEQARHVDATTAQLAQKAETLQHHEANLTEQRQEVDEHLRDMQEWYRKKMRDLAGIAIDDPTPRDLQAAPAAAPTTVPGDDDAILPLAANILSLTDPGDRRLGETLREFALVDDATLAALLGEARRQRRPLRQVLLKSGAVTLYQLALIEAGNVAGLMLGPVRLIDRLAVLPGETMYRVFDPRRDAEGLLRHLADKEAHDAVRPDEFRERFRQAMVDSPHLVATWEVLDIADRPAVLQEWLTGVPSSDWPPLAAAPGVCYRLLTQAALGLAAAHRAGTLHGHLRESSFVLTEDGILKLTGLGEPPWLHGANLEDEAGDEREDLRALGRVVSTWCSPSGVRRGAKTKPLPDALVSVLYKLASDADGYPSADALLAELDAAGADLPPNAEAWGRLLKYVREHATADIAIRRSA